MEIKGYTSHVKDRDRQKYSNELGRETFLCAMVYQVISFAYDDVEQHPELCITLLRLVLSRYLAATVPAGRTLLAEREVIRFVIRQAGTARPLDIVEHFDLDPKTVRHILHNLCAKGWLTPVIRGSGIRNVGMSWRVTFLTIGINRLLHVMLTEIYKRLLHAEETKDRLLGQSAYELG